MLVYQRVHINEGIQNWTKHFRTETHGDLGIPILGQLPYGLVHPNF